MEGVPDHKPPRPSAQRCPRIPPQGEGAPQAHRYELRDEGHFEWGHHVIWWSSSTPPENPVHESKVSAGGPDAGHRHLVARRSPERLCREGRSQHDTPHLRGPETLRGVESCHRHEEAQPTPAGPAVQASSHHSENRGEARRWSGFEWRGARYRYAVLPFGNRTSPWWLTRVLNPTIRSLRLRGVSIVVYVDDMLILGDSAAEGKTDTLATVRALTELGWHINYDKSVLVPQQKIEFLGYTLDLSGWPAIGLPPLKRRRIAHELSRASRSQLVRPRILARVVGLATSASKAVPQVHTFVRQ